MGKGRSGVEGEEGTREREMRIRPATAARIGTREGRRARHGVQGWPAHSVDEAVRSRGMGAACGEWGWPTRGSRVADSEADAWHAAMRASALRALHVLGL